MIIWRPSANSSRFAYSLVNDLDPEDEEEEKEMENKNFGKRSFTCFEVLSRFLSGGWGGLHFQHIPSRGSGDMAPPEYLTALGGFCGLQHAPHNPSMGVGGMAPRIFNYAGGILFLCRDC